MEHSQSNERPKDDIWCRLSDAIDNMSIGYAAIVVALAGLHSAWRDERMVQPPEAARQWVHVAASVIWIALLLGALLMKLPPKERPAQRD
jgi:hypothetical protein